MALEFVKQVQEYFFPDLRFHQFFKPGIKDMEHDTYLLRFTVDLGGRVTALPSTVK